MSFDMNVALDRVGGDEEILKEIAELFVEDAPSLMADIQQAIQANDTGALERAAHTMKGSVANFGAEAAVEAAMRLETMGRESNLADMETVFAVLEEAINDVVEALSLL